VWEGALRFKRGNDRSGVTGVIAAQGFELGTEPLIAQRVEELLDQRLVEVVFEHHNVVAYLLQRG
jgi:hypothetical protein